MKQEKVNIAILSYKKSGRKYISSQILSKLLDTTPNSASAYLKISDKVKYDSKRQEWLIL